MVAERRLVAMEDSLELIEEAIINMEVNRRNDDDRFNALQSSIEKKLAELIQTTMEPINKSISESSKSQSNLINGILSNQKDMEQKVMEQN